MRITQEAEYAMRIVCKLAESAVSDSEDVILGAAEISECTMIPQRFTLTILRKLVLCGVVRSYKGKKGGYVLQKAPKDISFREIIEIIDGPIAISKCVDDHNECSKHGFNKSECRVHNIFVMINTEMAERFERISVADAIDPAMPMSDIHDLIK